MKLAKKFLFILFFENVFQISLPLPKPKGVNVGKNIGGYLNLRLGKEGAPIYMDQSPSYIYKDPPSERN